MFDLPLWATAFLAFSTLYLVDIVAKVVANRPDWINVFGLILVSMACCANWFVFLYGWFKV